MESYVQGIKQWCSKNKVVERSV